MEGTFFTVLQNVAKDVVVNYKPEDIHQAHRLQQRRDGKPPTVIVQYYAKICLQASSSSLSIPVSDSQPGDSGYIEAGKMTRSDQISVTPEG
ncbi:hypothetical protein J6590_032514 [Homalodisca vitripennis]|nr:hypothetical protein J6590_032514 [Homalodisca vitripennis]